VSRESIEHLDLDDLVLLATGLLGDPPPIRDLGLLGAAAARPRAFAFGADAYPDTWTKAAALLQSIVKNHPLVDGNKRLGWLACAVFLDLNGIDPTRATNDDVVDFVIDVAASSTDVAELASRLRAIIENDAGQARS
jgi:death on curing protein